MGLTDDISVLWTEEIYEADPEESALTVQEAGGSFALVESIFADTNGNPLETDAYRQVNYVNDVSRTNTQALMEYAVNGGKGESRTAYTYGLYRESCMVAAPMPSVGNTYGESASSRGTYYYTGTGSVANLTGNGTGQSYSYGLNGEMSVYGMYGSVAGAGAGGTAMNAGLTGTCAAYAYNGEYTHETLGLQYLRARYYNMAAGVFTSRDTYAGRIQDILSQNRYTYAENNPVTYADPSGHISIKSAWNAVKTGAKAVASAVTAAVKTGAAAVSNAVKSVISKPTVSLGNTSSGTLKNSSSTARNEIRTYSNNQAVQAKAAKSAAKADLVGQPVSMCEAAAVWADWGAEKAAGYMDESFWGPGLMIGAYEVEAVKCFAYSQLENSIHLIIPEADEERMLRGAGLMLGGGFKSLGGFMLAAGSSTVSWAGIGVPGMIAGGFVIGSGASDMKQGWEEFFLGLSGDSTTQTRNWMSDLFYDGNDGIYHLSTGFAAFMGSLLTPYVNAAYGKTGTTAAGSTAGKATGVKPTVTEAAGGTVDDALEQFYDDIFESSYGEQFDPIREQAIAGAGDIAENSLGVNKIPDNNSIIGHIFRDVEGHISDTVENRILLESVANNMGNFQGVDIYGNEWYIKILDDGRQVWVQARNGNIFEGGINEIPKPWNPDTGLKKQ